MQDTCKQEIHDFIMKSYKESVRDWPDINDQTAARNVSIIEKYFIDSARIVDISEEFNDNVFEIYSIISIYRHYLCKVAKCGGYTLDELDLIIKLYKNICYKSQDDALCLKRIIQCKNAYLRNEYVRSIADNTVLNIDDPIEKLYELKLISKGTFNCLCKQFNSGKNDIANIVYAPKMWLYNLDWVTYKRRAELMAFIDTYPIQGRIIPTKEDIKRVLKKANTGIDILDDSNGIINTYFLSDMSVDDIREHLDCNLDTIHEFIDWFLRRVEWLAYMNKWDSLLDLVTVSSMMDLYAARHGDYDKIRRLTWIAENLRTCLSSNE